MSSTLVQSILTVTKLAEKSSFELRQIFGVDAFQTLSALRLFNGNVVKKQNYSRQILCLYIRYSKKRARSKCKSQGSLKYLFTAW